MLIGVIEGRHFGVFMVNFEQISHIVLMFPLFTLITQILSGFCFSGPQYENVSGIYYKLILS